MFLGRYRNLTNTEYSVYSDAENRARYPKWGLTVRKYCKEHNISKSKYYRIKRIADIKVLEACKQAAIICAIEDKKIQDMIYSTTLWGGGYNGMTPLEFRLAYNIPAKTFYKYSGYLHLSRPKMCNLYPCECLRRKPGRHRRNNILSESLKGWFSKSDCLHCKGTGMTQFGSRLIITEYDKKRILRKIKESA